MQLDLAAWRALVERDLKGASASKLVRRTDEGLAIQPLYTAADEGPALGRDGRLQPGWKRIGLHGHSRAEVLEARIAQDVAGGVDGVLIDVPRCESMIGALPGVLARIPANISISLLNPSEELVREAPLRSGGLGLSPFTYETFTEATALARQARLAVELAGVPGRQLFEVDGHAWHFMGAGEVQEVALMLAEGVTLLRALENEGLPPAQGAALIGFTLAAGTRFFEAIGKIRAFRACWLRVLEVCGAEPSALRLRVRPSARQWTRYAPHLNLLRNTVACFAGAVAGADEIVGVPFDVLGGGSDQGLRLARNTAAILAEESHLDRALDPAGGSWFVEALSTSIAEAAWQHFQSIEAQGGLMAVLDAERAAAFATGQARAKRIATRRQPIIGVSEHAEGEGIKAVYTPPQPGARDAQGFENLRDLGQRVSKQTGAAPTIFLCALGARSAARVGFVSQLLAVGGIGVVTGELADFAGAPVTCLCGHDDDYATQAEAAARALKAAGCAYLLLAGAPGEREAALRAAGIDDFIALGGDALATLRTIWQHLEPSHD